MTEREKATKSELTEAALQAKLKELEEVLRAVDGYLTPRVSNSGVTGRTVILPMVKNALSNPSPTVALQRALLDAEIKGAKGASGACDAYQESYIETLRRQRDELGGV